MLSKKIDLVKGRFWNLKCYWTLLLSIKILIFLDSTRYSNWNSSWINIKIHMVFWDFDKLNFDKDKFWILIRQWNLLWKLNFNFHHNAKYFFFPIFDLFPKALFIEDFNNNSFTLWFLLYIFLTCRCFFMVRVFLGWGFSGTMFRIIMVADINWLSLK